MQPFLLAAKQSGVRGFVDCTPAYVGRDPRILKKLAQNTGLHILTNTGYYGDGEGRYLPPSAHTETAAQIAARWLAEWRDGIEDTGIRPGFIKTRVDGLVGRSIANDGDGWQITRRRCQGQPRNSNGGDLPLAGRVRPVSRSAFCCRGWRRGQIHRRSLRRQRDRAEPENCSCWFVGVDRRNRTQTRADHVAIVAPLLQRSPDRLLLSMDSGWYNVGEADGGKINGFTALMDAFFPRCVRREFPPPRSSASPSKTRRVSSRRRRSGAGYPGLGIGLGCACCDWPGDWDRVRSGTG